MKLISWNVNGLRAVIKKGFKEFFEKEDADIFCIQETKMQQDQIDDEIKSLFSKYNCYWNSAIRKGYSGTAVFTKQKPLNVTYGIGIEEHDQEGRIITLEFEKFYLVNCYTPNSKRELERLEYRMTWEDEIKNYLLKLNETKPVILCGDLNVAHKEIDLKNPKSNRKNAGFTDEERGKMTELLDAGFTDTFRYLYPTKENCYTWWSYMFNARANNAGWRIDYFIVSQSIEKEVKEARYGEIAIVQTISDISIGDTICDINHINPLPPIIIEEPTMSMNFLVNSSPFAGRSGKFLTNRHIKERLDREFDLSLITTSPSVIYKVHKTNGEVIDLYNPSELPMPNEISYIEEPFVTAEILTPKDYVGGIMEICQNRRGIYVDMKYLDQNRVTLIYELPLNEIIYDFFDNLKSKTKGYASFDYEFKEYRRSELVKLDIWVNGESVDALSFIVHKDMAYDKGKKMVEKLKTVIPRHLFTIPIQAVIGGKIIARETISAMRKDVLAKCYGGDITRKKKLLEKQKRGKKKMREIGNVEIPQEAFLSVLKLDDENK